jgi:hypothetical protein
MPFDADTLEALGTILDIPLTALLLPAPETPEPVQEAWTGPVTDRVRGPARAPGPDPASGGRR